MAETNRPARSSLSLMALPDPSDWPCPFDDRMPSNGSRYAVGARRADALNHERSQRHRGHIDRPRARGAHGIAASARLQSRHRTAGRTRACSGARLGRRARPAARSRVDGRGGTDSRRAAPVGRRLVAVDRVAASQARPVGSRDRPDRRGDGASGSCAEQDSRLRVVVRCLIAERVRQLRPVGDAQLDEHLPQVVSDGTRADEQLFGNFLVRGSLARQQRDLALLSGQRFRPVAVRAPACSPLANRPTRARSAKASAPIASNIP